MALLTFADQYPPFGAAVSVRWVTPLAAPNWHYCAECNRLSVAADQSVTGSGRATTADGAIAERSAWQFCRAASMVLQAAPLAFSPMPADEARFWFSLGSTMVGMPGPPSG